MPVKFRGNSEYSTMYKWSPSYRSAEFKPTEQQCAIEAGLRSDEMMLLMEPTFTRKRRVFHPEPQAQSCLQWCDDQMENEQEVKQNFENNFADKTYIKKSEHFKKSSAVQPKPKFQGLADKTYKIAEKLSSPNKHESQDSPADRMEKKLESSKRLKKLYEIENHLKDKEIIKDRTKPSQQLPQPKPNSPPRQHSPKRKASSSKPDNVVQKKEAKKESKSNNVPLRYRSLNSRMMSAHQTEYQQMFRRPKRFVPSSPLISALDVVHQSSAAIPPHVVNKSPKMRLKSEYASSYQNGSPLSKSLTLPRSPASPSMKLKVKNIATSPLQPRTSKKVVSEYSTQFPDREFQVEQHTNALQEANQNKQNRDAKQFDPDHATQLHSPKNKFWDILSATESNADSYSVSDVPSFTKDRKLSAKSKNVDSCSVESIKGSDDDCEILKTENSVSGSSKQSLNAALPVVRKLAWGEGDSRTNDSNAATIDDVNDETESDVASSVTLTDANINEGRLPTPQLRKMGGALRTHHDVTTPSRGGALLTSPPRRTSLRSSVSSPSLVSKASSTISSIKAKTEPEESRKGKKSPTSGCRMVKTDLDIPRRIQPTYRAPIKGALKNQEFQHCGKNTRPVSAVERISMLSNRSNASAAQLLERSMQRKNFWNEK